LLLANIWFEPFVKEIEMHELLFCLRFLDSVEREDAHSRLELLYDGSFIVRRNPQNGQYALSVRYMLLV